MSRLQVCTILSLVFTATASLQAQEQLGREIILDLIERLGSQKYVERDRATRELIRIGKDALPLLRKETSSSDMEVRQRVDTIINTVEARMRNDSLIRPTRLALKYDKQPLDSVLADVNKKTGLKLMLDPKSNKDPKQQISINTGEVPFWEAVDKLLESAGLDENVAGPPAPNPKENARARQFVGGGIGGMPRNALYGPQSVQAIDKTIRLVERRSAVASATSTIARIKALPANFPALIAGKSANEIAITLDVTPEPSVSWIGIVDVEVRRAMDEHGTSLTQSLVRNNSTTLNDANWQAGVPIMILNGRPVAVDPDLFELAGAPLQQRHVSFRLLSNDIPSKMLNELEGTVFANVLTPSQTLVTIDNLLTAKINHEVKRSLYSLNILDRKMQRSTLYIRLRMEVPLSESSFTNQMIGTFDSMTGNLGLQRIEFAYESGKSIANTCLRLIDDSVNGQIYSSEIMAVIPMNGEKNEDGVVKLTLSGRKTACVELPFRLKNVPLP